MAAVLLAAGPRLDVPGLPGIGAKALGLAGLIAGGALVYFLSSFLFGGREVRLVASVLRRGP
jgi:hypothetical protein